MKIGEHDFEVRYDYHPGPSSSQWIPDIEWSFTDGQGHAHYWVQTTYGEYLLPTLAQIEEERDEPKHGMYSTVDSEARFTYHVCSRCGQVIAPKHKLEYFPSEMIRGRPHFFVDGEERTLNEFLIAGMEAGMHMADLRDLLKAREVKRNDTSA